MALERTRPREQELAPPASEPGPGLRLTHSPAQGAAVADTINRKLRIALPVINLASVAATYVFITYVAPLPGGAPPFTADLIGTIVLVALCWLICDWWGTRLLRPLRPWLAHGRPPNPEERLHTLRAPLYEAGTVFAVWLGGGIAAGVLDIALGSAASSGALAAVIVVLGGLVASALCYLAVEWIARPATALALASDPPSRPLTPGIGARIYLAWEFGTAVAVGGIVVVALARLFGAHISAHRLAATVIFLGVIALTVGLGALLVAVRSVSDPVRALRGAMARVEAGDNDVAVAVNDGSEVGLLQAGFNRMVAGLRERDRVRDLFGRHVGEEVAHEALGRGIELGGELREAAVLFVDVVGSTAFAAARDPHEVVETLNRFFEIVMEVATLHGGWINKFEGDAALCVFGAPTEHPDAASAALAAGRELCRRLQVELDGIDAAIGLSAGQVVAGNIGAARRYEYTVIGDPVNEASRLTELAKSRPSRLLASEAILGRASQREAGRWQLGESVTLRGRPDATRVAIPA